MKAFKKNRCALILLALAVTIPPVVFAETLSESEEPTQKVSVHVNPKMLLKIVNGSDETVKFRSSDEHCAKGFGEQIVPGRSSRTVKIEASFDGSCLFQGSKSAVIRADGQDGFQIVARASGTFTANNPWNFELNRSKNIQYSDAFYGATGTLMVRVVIR